MKKTGREHIEKEFLELHTPRGLCRHIWSTAGLRTSSLRLHKELELGHVQGLTMPCSKRRKFLWDLCSYVASPAWPPLPLLMSLLQLLSLPVLAPPGMSNP